MLLGEQPGCQKVLEGEPVGRGLAVDQVGLPEGRAALGWWATPDGSRGSAPGSLPGSGEPVGCRDGHGSGHVPCKSLSPLFRPWEVTTEHR